MSELVSSDITKLTPKQQAERIEQDAAEIINGSGNADAARTELLKETLYLKDRPDTLEQVTVELDKDKSKGSINALIGQAFIMQERRPLK